MSKLNDTEYVKLANKKAKRIIKENIFMSLATCDKKHIPWDSPVRYYLDKNYNFYFVSSKYSKHMRNIESNPNVAFSIFDSRARGDDIDGVQVKAKAKVLGRLELLKVVKIIYAILEYSVKTPSVIKQYKGISVMRLVKISPLEIYKYDTRSKPGEDTRVKVELNP